MIMKIAVAYEQGDIFQHFGKSKHFKVYEAENGTITASHIIDAEGSGHSALSDFLKSEGVDTVICGGIGEGAISALSENGIDLVSGITGSADEAARMYLKGELASQGANCSHHEEENHACCSEEEGHACAGHHCGESSEEMPEENVEEEHHCGEAGGCGGCSGCGGGEAQILFEGKNAGKTVHTHYRGTLNDGTQFDSSYDRGEPLAFTSGIGMMIPGFDKAVVNMEPGEKCSVHLTPEEAYGEPDPQRVISVNIAELEGAEEMKVGQRAYLQNMYGQPIPVRVTEMDDTMITFDANHELAGKELNFEIELISVED